MNTPVSPLRLAAAVLGLDALDDQQLAEFLVERELMLRRTQALLHTERSDAPTAMSAIEDRIAQLSPLDWMEPALVAHVRSLGCRCPRPLLGYRPDVGPRCRLCGVEPKSETETR